MFNNYNRMIRAFIKEIKEKLQELWTPKSKRYTEYELDKISDKIHDLMLFLGHYSNPYTDLEGEHKDWNITDEKPEWVKGQPNSVGDDIYIYSAKGFPEAIMKEEYTVSSKPHYPSYLIKSKLAYPLKDGVHWLVLEDEERL